MPIALTVCVFCGSSPGARSGYADDARALGRAIVERGHSLVYGGGGVGLMGIVADAVLEGGGQVVGVIPGWMADHDVAHRGLSELRLVDTMHTRKTEMAERASAFVAMPGGLGTLEELFEVLTWAQLGLHAKPCGLLNSHGYFDSLLHFLDSSVEQRFVRPEHRQLLLTDTEPLSLLQRIESQHLERSARLDGDSARVGKWIDRT